MKNECDSVDISETVYLKDKEAIFMRTEYPVKYTDNTGDGDDIIIFGSVEDAEAAIDEELKNIKALFLEKGLDYNYGDFVTDEGLVTEIWACGNDDYASWTRLWDAD